MTEKPRTIGKGVTVEKTYTIGETHLRSLEARADDAGKLRDALERMLFEFDLLIEGGQLPDIRNDLIFVNARAALAAESQSGWRDIAIAPKDGTIVVLGWALNCADPMVMAGWFETGPADQCWYAIDHERCPPTHWMPLPPPPSET